MSNEANNTQVGGAHYAGEYQHWDFCNDVLDGRYMEGQITKYVSRARKKNGLQDLQKAAHFAQKLQEMHAASQYNPQPVLRSMEAVRKDERVVRFAKSAALNNIETELLNVVAYWRHPRDLKYMRELIAEMCDRATQEQRALDAAKAGAAPAMPPAVRGSTPTEPLPVHSPTSIGGAYTEHAPTHLHLNVEKATGQVALMTTPPVDAAPTVLMRFGTADIASVRRAFLRMGLTVAPAEQTTALVFKDGEMWCALNPFTFDNLQQNNASFGHTPMGALVQHRPGKPYDHDSVDIALYELIREFNQSSKWYALDDKRTPNDWYDLLSDYVHKARRAMCQDLNRAPHFLIEIANIALGAWCAMRRRERKALEADGNYVNQD